MSELKKIELIVKNYNVKNSADIDTLYDQVRCEDNEGKTFHFKEVCMLDYLKRHGAIVTDKPRTWYYKHLNKDRVPGSGVTEPTEGALRAKEVGHRGFWLTLSLRRPNEHQENHDDQVHYRIDRAG